MSYVAGGRCSAVLGTGGRCSAVFIRRYSERRYKNSSHEFFSLFLFVKKSISLSLSFRLAISLSRHFHYFKAAYSAFISFTLIIFGLAFTLA